MAKRSLLIRNDDVAADTRLEQLQWFCETCDKFGCRIVHAVTPVGVCIPVAAKMADDTIAKLGGSKTIAGHATLLKYLRERIAKHGDEIAVHGAPFHTHICTETGIAAAAGFLRALDLTPTRWVPPFNYGIYPKAVAGLPLFQFMPNLERYLKNQDNFEGEECYTHSWRYDPPGHLRRWRLESGLERLTAL
jgi:hypothetical protein